MNVPRQRRLPYKPIRRMVFDQREVVVNVHARSGHDALAMRQQILDAMAQGRGFATGGIVTKPTLTWVGEQGPELIA